MKDEVVFAEVLVTDPHQWMIIDVRSPGEFAEGHIPGAVNIPLFTNEERAKVGTLYTQVSKEAAMEEGLAIAGIKMLSYVQSAKQVESTSQRKMVIHCWRGGNRSKAMCWLFNFSGIQAARLSGGYKSFRQGLHHYFEATPFDLRILGGCTGAGKTEILKCLKDAGAQVVDLEGLAHHKGSAFGSIGEQVQDTSEQFENNLYLEFKALDPTKPIWLENESKSIGRNHIPDALWDKMRDSKLYAIEVDETVRLERALRYYCEPVETERLKESFVKIKKRIGGLDFQIAIEALDQHDLKTAAAIALKYYDKAYRFQLESWPKDKVIPVEPCNEVDIIAQKLLMLVKEEQEQTHTIAS